MYQSCVKFKAPLILPFFNGLPRYTPLAERTWSFGGMLKNIDAMFY